MTTPIRVKRERRRGYKMPPHTKSVTRGSRWGNPFRVGQNDPTTTLGEPMTAARAVELFEKACNTPSMHQRIRDELRGWNLACYCEIGRPCHADVLLRIANQ